MSHHGPIRTDNFLSALVVLALIHMVECLRQ